MGSVEERPLLVCRGRFACFTKRPVGTPSPRRSINCLAERPSGTAVRNRGNSPQRRRRHHRRADDLHDLPTAHELVTPAAPAVTSTVAVSKENATAPQVAGQENGDAPFWKRPWSWVAGAAVFALLLVEVVGWRRHHRRKHDAKVLASIVPTVTPGDREADYHPRPSQPPDHSRPFGAG